MGVYEYNMGSWRYFHKLYTSIRPRGVSDMTENLVKKTFRPPWNRCSFLYTICFSSPCDIFEISI